jgi:hypothetical protein
MRENEITIDSSNEYDAKFIGGEVTRAKAENVAKVYLGFE